MSLEIFYKIQLNKYESIIISEDSDGLGLIQIRWEDDSLEEAKQAPVEIRFDKSHANDVIKSLVKIYKFIVNIEKDDKKLEWKIDEQNS